MAAKTHSFDLRQMLASGELRHKIIKDHRDRNLNLQSIEFDRKYNIQEILNNRSLVPD